jgi:phosphate-selective porin OprO/OprP
MKTLLIVMIGFHLSVVLRGQEHPPATSDSGAGDTIEAGESALEEPKRKLVRWNEYEGPRFTIRMGAGLLYDFAAYSQDEESKEQFPLSSTGKIRDFRFLLKGGFPSLSRAVTWTCGVMYDGATGSWLFRETGVMVAVPEIWGHVFLGRTKEGFSLNKVMSGYSGWTLERATMSDASIPLLADGIKWLGYLPEKRVIWNVGWYQDWVSEGQSFSSYDRQAVARAAWLPVFSAGDETLLHVGVNLRWGEPNEGELQLRSRPEASPAPYFVDTGRFPASSTRMAGYEVYYRRGSWLFGSEYWLEDVSSEEAGDPLFHGGDVVATWLITGETRAYNTVGGYFQAISPARTVFEGGPGAWEAVLRLSYIDLDAGNLRGGKFWRLTPMINWHLSDNLRLEFAYGYGRLDRFDLQGGTQFFQGRLQAVF